MISSVNNDKYYIPIQLLLIIIKQELYHHQLITIIKVLDQLEIVIKDKESKPVIKDIKDKESKPVKQQE